MSEVEINLDKMELFIEDFNTKQGKYDEIVSQLTEYVDDFSENSDLAYKHLQGCLQDLTDEIEQSTSATQGDINSVKVTNPDGSLNRDSELGRIISNTKTTLANISQYLNNMQHTDQKIFGEIKNHISKVDDVKKSIQNVEELSTDIEILAFNAMIVAAKAGAEGLAFSCITDELKNISNQTLLIVNDLMGLEKNLFEHYNKFQETITIIEENHHETLQFLNVNVEETFSEFVIGVDTIGEMGYNLVGYFTNISPVFSDIRKIINLKKEIPESVQIVREALRIINKNKDELLRLSEYDVYSILQLLIGQTKISKYCNTLFFDIKEHIDLSMFLLSEKLTNIQQKVENVKETQRVLQEYFSLQHKNFGEPAIPLMFSDTVKVISHIADLIQTTTEGKRKISENGNSLIGRIEQLEEQFLVLTKTAKKFNLINISSKIEIAKRKVLSNHGNISDKIEEITEEIGKTLYQTYDQLVLIKKSTQHLLNQYNTNMEAQMLRAHEILETMGKATKEYQSSCENISAVFSGINVVSDRFIELVRISKEDILEIAKLEEYAEHISELFRNINNLTDESKLMLLEITNVSEKGIATPHYDRIFKKIDVIENVYKDFLDANKSD